MEGKQANFVYRIRGNNFFYSATEHLKNKNYKDSFLCLLNTMINNNTIKTIGNEKKLNIKLTVVYENINQERTISNLTLKQIEEILSII
jgi:hypothetical protein